MFAAWFTRDNPVGVDAGSGSVSIVPASAEDGIASDPGLAETAVGWLAAFACAGLVSDTTVPPPKMTRFVSIKVFLDFARCCFSLAYAINVSLGSGGKSTMKRHVFR